MIEEKSVADLNPRAQAIKAIEMSIRRALGLIEEFEKLEPGQDWTDVEMTAYRRILGTDHYAQRAVLSECWSRFKDGSLYSQVLEWSENLPPSVAKKEEVKDGLDQIRDRLTG